MRSTADRFSKRIEKALTRIWKVLISLKLAVIIIASLAISLATATTIESLHGAKTAQYYVYRATWFYLLLTALGLNILAVALSRLPWKKRHTPFLLAHLGILMILTGSWITYVKGLDGTLRLSEGEVSSAVELDEHVLLFKRGEEVEALPFEWMPEGKARDFKPRDYPKYNVRIEKYTADAEPQVRFLPQKGGGAAVQIKILGAPMGGTPELWLWSGDAGWSTQKLGLARFLITKAGGKALGLDQLESTPGEARFQFHVDAQGALTYETTSIRGEKKTGRVDLAKVESREDPVIINPGWRMPIQIQVKKFVREAQLQTEYVPPKNKGPGMGSPLPQPAIYVSLISNPESRLWLGIGDRAELTDKDGSKLMLGYFPKRVVLPYALRLKEFELKHDPGTRDAASYSSYVQVIDQFQKTEKDLNSVETKHITMNEPLTVKGYTFYQASYIPEEPRPTTTILSVNYDPGRLLKYWGSLILIAGCIALYLVKVIEKRRPAS